MENLLLQGYELLTVLLPCALAAWVLRRRGQCMPPVLTAVFVLYLFGVLHVTSAGTIFDVLWRGAGVHGQVNLLPFSQEVDWTGYALNVLLFMPLGVLLPLLCPWWARLRRVAAAGLSLSLLIEVSQLFNNRSTDVDDLLMNTLGAVLGFVLFRMIYRRCAQNGAETAGRCLALIYVLAAFGGRMLLFNEFGAAGLLYGI